MKKGTSLNKILYVATSDIHIHTFHIPYLKWLKEYGCEIHVAVENRSDIGIPFADKVFYVSFPRTPFSFVNFSTYNTLKAIILENRYDLIHCHTPIPSALTRVAARKSRKKGTKVLYTAHGFHFFNGGPLKFWVTFYPIEWLLSAFTDGIITINSEDYRHIKGKMLHKDSYYIKGIGVDASKFKTLSEVERIQIRRDYGYERNDFLLIYIAEFIYRKNHKFIIESLTGLIKKIPNVKVLFAGKGVLLDDMKAYAKRLNLDKYINFLGFRSDLEKLASISDLGISSSKQEGLGLGLAEEMLCSVPVIATIDRGHKEMIIHGENGFLYKKGDQAEFISYVVKLYNDPMLRKRFGNEAYLTSQIFRIENSRESMAVIYKKYLRM